MLTTPKADTILAIIGGVFVFWYAILHWIGKLYNSFRVRAKMAEEIYDEENINESPLNKFFTTTIGLLSPNNRMFGIQ